MQQLKKPNLTVTGRPGWCLEYAHKVFGTPVIDATAWLGWEATKYKHSPSEALPGIPVPVWFSGANGQGHVVVYTPNGFYSSPYQLASGAPGEYNVYVNGVAVRAILPSIAIIEQIYGVKYVGWSEDIETLRVVIGDTMSTKSSVTTLYQLILGRAPDAGGLAHYSAMDTDAVIADLMASAERKTYLAKQAAATKATNDKITALSANLLSTTNKLTEANKEIALLEAMPVGSSTSPSDSAAIQETNSIVKQIWAKITSIFK